MIVLIALLAVICIGAFVTLSISYKENERLQKIEVEHQKEIDKLKSDNQSLSNMIQKTSDVCAALINDTKKANDEHVKRIEFISKEKNKDGEVCDWLNAELPDAVRLQFGVKCDADNQSDTTTFIAF